MYGTGSHPALGADLDGPAAHSGAGGRFLLPAFPQLPLRLCHPHSRMSSFSLHSGTSWRGGGAAASQKGLQYLLPPQHNPEEHKTEVLAVSISISTRKTTVGALTALSL